MSQTRNRSCSNVYTFFDPENSIQDDLVQLIDVNIPIEYATLINKVNKHDRGLSMLGILPIHLRSLLMVDGKNHAQQAMQDIRKDFLARL